MPPLVLSEESGPASAGGRCVRACPVAEDTAVRLPSDGAAHAASSQGAVRGSVSDTGRAGPLLGQVVCGGYDHDYCRPLVHSPVAECVVPGGGLALHPSGPGTAAGGLALERRRLSNRGLSPAVINTIQSARAASTASVYCSKWVAFARWCGEREVAPESCSVETILEFLQHLLDQGSGLAASTVKVYACAISACHEGFAKTTVFGHPLVKRFLTGVRRLRPVRKATAPPWDLLLVLRALCEAPFEPLEQVPLKWLSIKTALLLALTSGKRVSDLRALTVAHITGDGSRAVLRTDPSFVPKVVRSAFKSRDLVLGAFYPPPHGSEEEARLHLLCPVRVLGCYVRRTAAVRSTPQLLVCHGSGRVAVVQTTPLPLDL